MKFDTQNLGCNIKNWLPLFPLPDSYYAGSSGVTRKVYTLTATFPCTCGLARTKPA